MSKSQVETVGVVIAGINGKMGRSSARVVLQDPTLDLIGAFGRDGAGYVGSDVAKIAQIDGGTETGILVSSGFLDSVRGKKPDVLLELTKAESALEHAKLAIENGIRPVIGASGLPAEGVEELSALCARKGIGAFIVPNFSIGAVLMMEFARQAAAMFENVEIIEMHHTQKADAPSGTAMHTARQLSSVGKDFNTNLAKEKELVPGARGGKVENNVRIHSLRLPGLISHQEVIFGSPGELLTVRHDSFNTDCFARGIALAVKSVMTFDRLVIGLDKVLNLSN